MKTKKLLLPSIITLVIALFTVILTGCTYSKEERAERKKIVETAKQNAAHYIKEKYGFDNAKITKALNINKGQPGGLLYTARPASGDVRIYMEYEGKPFEVVIDGTQETTKGYDNYQQDDLVAAYQAYLSENIGLDICGITLKYGYGTGYSLEDRINGCINTYYDGSNLLDIFQTNEYTVCAGIATTETGLKTLTARNFKREFWLDSYGITSYRNKSMADAVSEHSIGDIHSNLEGKTFIPFLANEYVGGYAKGSNYPIDYYKFTLKKAGDIFVVAANDDTLSVSDSKMGIAKCLGNGKSYKQLTGTYKVSSSDGFYIYIPESIFNADTSQDSSYCIVKQYYRDSAGEYRYEKDDLYYKQYGYYTCYGKTRESKDYRISVVQTEK